VRLARQGHDCVKVSSHGKNILSTSFGILAGTVMHQLCRCWLQLPTTGVGSNPVICTIRQAAADCSDQARHQLDCVSTSDGTTFPHHLGSIGVRPRKRDLCTPFVCDYNTSSLGDVHDTAQYSLGSDSNMPCYQQSPCHPVINNHACHRRSLPTQHLHLQAPQGQTKHSRHIVCWRARCGNNLLTTTRLLLLTRLTQRHDGPTLKSQKSSDEIGILMALPSWRGVR
jgi:hypothetical protein